jgi:hypothetical protein
MVFPQGEIMGTRYFMGVYWPARKESVEECADRALRFFGDLMACDSALSTWYEKRRSRKQALAKRANVANREYLLGRLKKGRNRQNIRRTAIEDLGFSFGLWNGGEDAKDADLYVRCGLYWQSPNPQTDLGNCVTLDFPEDLGSLRQSERMASVLTAAAKAWNPEWAGIMSHEAMDARGFSTKRPFLDWMVFVPRKINKVPLPSSVTTVGNGSLIVIQANPPVVGDAGSQEQIRRIDSILQS